jgi:hypothetical protein
VNQFENTDKKNDGEALVDMPVVSNGLMTVRRLWLELESLGLTQAQTVAVVNFMIDEGLARREG